MRRVLTVPGYLRLSAAYAGNELAWFVGTLALSVLVYRRTGSALGSMGFFLCSQAVPGLISPLIVGRLDRVSPRRVLPAVYWTEALLFGLLAWLTSRFLLAPVLAIVIVDGVLALVARSLANGARSEVLKPVGLVREGGALQNLLFSVAYLLGPLLGGLVAALGGTVAALYVDCGLFAMIGLSLVSETVPDAIVHDGPERGRLRGALGYVRSQRVVVTVLALQTAMLVCFCIPTPVEVVYVVHVLGGGTAAYGVFLTVWGGGAVLGGVLFVRWRQAQLRPLLVAATVIMGVGFAVLAIASSLAVAFAGAAIAGIGNGLCSTAIATELMDIVPQSWVALVGSLSVSINQLAPGAGILIGGVMAELVSARASFAAAAAGSTVVVVGCLVLLAPARIGCSGRLTEAATSPAAVTVTTPPEPVL